MIQTQFSEVIYEILRLISGNFQVTLNNYPKTPALYVYQLIAYFSVLRNLSSTTSYTLCNVMTGLLKHFPSLGMLVITFCPRTFV